MTIKEFSRFFLGKLAALYSIREAGQITEIVFEEVTGFTRLDMITKHDTELPGFQEGRLMEMLHQLLSHVPMQYVLGEAWFYKMKFYVNEHVLIPRPETEELVSWIIEDVKKEVIDPQKDSKYSLTVLDIGTGSGCIAIALKKNISGIRMMAIDKSEAAIITARKNAILNKEEINFMQADIFNRDACSQLPNIDIIVSNPPYIPLKEKNEMQLQVAEYEPSLALFVPDNDPLCFYKAILQLADKKLVSNGKVYTEIHESFGKEVQGLFLQYGFKELILRTDMSGRDRMVSGKK